MRKLQQLHQFLTEHNTAARVSSWAQDIKLKFASDSLDDGFTITYKAMFLLSSLPADNDVIGQVAFFLAKKDQHAEPIFDTDVVNNDKIDLMIEVDFFEQANLVADSSGKYQVGDVRHSLVYEGFVDFNGLVEFVDFTHE